jgi:UDP-N-acetylmuramate--alanine ligase
VRAQGRTAEHVADRPAIGEALLAEAREGDRILIMGARDDSLSEFAAELVAGLGKRS